MTTNTIEATMNTPATPAPTKKGFAVTSLVTGIVGLTTFWVPGLGLLLGIIATVFGGMGLYNANHGKSAGKGLAVSGLVLGILTVLPSILFLVIAATPTG